MLAGGSRTFRSNVCNCGRGSRAPYSTRAESVALRWRHCGNRGGNAGYLEKPLHPTSLPLIWQGIFKTSRRNGFDALLLKSHRKTRNPKDPRGHFSTRVQFR